MKKTILICLLLLGLLFSLMGVDSNPDEKQEMGFSFTYELTKNQAERRIQRDPATCNAGKDRWQARRSRKAIQLRKLGLSTQLFRKADTVQAVTISGNIGSENSIADYSGDCIFMGTCTNTGSTGAVFVEVTADFYGAGDVYLGSETTYVDGGSNVRLSSGSYTNALGSGQTGFFKIYSDIPYASVSYVNYRFNHSSYGYSASYASLAFVQTPIASSDYSGDLELAGQIENRSGAYLTYFTEVCFAALDSSGKVLDVDSTYVTGSTYDYGSGSTDTALEPRAKGSYSNNFSYAPYADYDSYLHAFEWNEVNTSPYGEQDPPFGSWDTPIHGSNVRSSIAVTGWALDDTEVASVKIYRNPESGEPTQPNGYVYIGDAVFIQGARADVEALYPNYPLSDRAGWGFMLLTNFLPNSGNGTFVLRAIATDTSGKTYQYPAKTITVDNANAVKPFGAIDTPTQGGSASGNDFINFGWALTPQPNMIPTDGSTLKVWVNSIEQGHPVYNNYRADIATLFPSYANSSAAIGYFVLDTTGFSDGLHAIEWSVVDDAGNVAGIGSRFFRISNGSSDAGIRNGKESGNSIDLSKNDISQMQIDSSPVSILKGFKSTVGTGKMTSIDSGMVLDPSERIRIREMERVVIKLGSDDSSPFTSGYLRVGEALRPLPIGSTLKDGSFHWIPGPGFYGKYRLVFVNSRRQTRREIAIEIGPKYPLN